MAQDENHELHYYEQKGYLIQKHVGPHCPYVTDKKISLTESRKMNVEAELCTYCYLQEPYYASVTYIPSYHSSIHIFDLTNKSTDSIFTNKPFVDFTTSDGLISISVMHESVNDTVIECIRNERKAQRAAFTLGLLGGTLSTIGTVQSYSSNFNSAISGVNLRFTGNELFNLGAYASDNLRSREKSFSSLDIAICIQNNSDAELQLSNSITGQLFYLMPGERKIIVDPDFLFGKYRTEILKKQDSHVYHIWFDLYNYLIAGKDVYQDNEKYILKMAPFGNKHYITEQEQNGKSEYYKVIKEDNSFISISEEEYKNYHKLKKIESYYK